MDFRRLRDANFDSFEGNNERSIAGEIPSLEKLMLRSERKDTLGRRILIRALGLVAYIPELTYDLEDVDQDRVKLFMKHPELLKAIDDWILEPKQEYVPKLKEALKVFKPIQRKEFFPKLFRGINPKSVEQDTMGLQRKGWFGPKPADFKVGDKFSYVTDRALSFTYHECTAKVFGGVVVSIDQRRYNQQLLFIDPDISYAIMETDETDYSKLPYYVTYGEFILFPNGKPVEFQVESINDRKSTA